MEDMVMERLFGGIYRGKKVLITGHTGFKGSWLALWLHQMGADVIGYSLPPPTEPNHIKFLTFEMVSVLGDIRDLNKLNETFTNHKPDIVFHLAAQSLVRTSYENPVETYEINVIGTLKLFEVCRAHNVKAIINITSDKAYENREWIWGYRENDPLGGYDPYSSSKGCADILASSYRNSYFNLSEYKKSHNTLLASCRAGNVIGGGDWAKDRLMTDIILSVSQEKKVNIRNPYATRPWQHVLEPLSGYLALGEKLLKERVEFAEAWNFGPSDDGNITVEDVVNHVKKYWDSIDYEITHDLNQLHEANLLKLDCSKAHIRLKWKEVWDSETTFEKTVLWYKAFYDNGSIGTMDDLHQYVRDARKKKLEWSKE